MTKQHIQLLEADKDQLKTLLSSGTMQARSFKRAQGLLYLDEGKSYVETAKLLSIRYMTVCNWATTYKRMGLSFLKDKERSGRPIKFDGTERAKITALACSESPNGYSQWSLRLLADRVVELEIVSEISHTMVGNILKKTLYSPIENANGVSDH